MVPGNGKLQCRLLPLETADGPTNMAADEVLLESAVASEQPALRFYGWSAATLSLGYFQPAAARFNHPTLRTLPWVRRPTGGEALVHDRELTYALVLPADLTNLADGNSWPRRLHAIIRGVLADLQVASQLASEESRRGDFLCFLHTTPQDLLIGQHKIVGSAQRKRHGGILQHGSILLASCPFTPELPGIVELTGRNISAELLVDAIAAQFQGETGWKLNSEVWTHEERNLIHLLGVTRFRAPAWNEKR